MANERIILADGISDVPHLEAFDAMVAARMSAIEADAVLVYLIDTVSAEALPWLARQFDVLGYRGYVLASTDAERRAIIKQAIELKRYMGTVWAVREAMKAVGYADAILTEGVDQPTIAEAAAAAATAAAARTAYEARVAADSGTMEGGDCWEDAAEELAAETDSNWAKFRVETDLGDSKGLDSETATRLARLITEYKNARSHLLDISFKSSIVDVLPALTANLNFDFYQPDITDDLGWFGRFYNAEYTYNGSIRYIESNDGMTVQILPA